MPSRNYYAVLIHPGLNGSGPDHWHTHWQQAFPDLENHGVRSCNPTSLPRKSKRCRYNFSQQ
jgi:predicted alpha/beta hydrolase family esterase